MTNHDKADMLIKTIKIWQFLQFFDSLVEVGDERATTILNGHFSRYGLSVSDLKENGVLPFAQLKTTLSILMSTLCFARWEVDDSIWKKNMKGASDYNMEYEGSTDPSMSEMIRTIRNATAHGFDNEDSITFPKEKVVSFQATHSGVSKVTFCSKEGFVEFLRDYVKVVQNTVVDQMQKST